MRERVLCKFFRSKYECSLLIGLNYCWQTISHETRIKIVVLFSKVLISCYFQVIGFIIWHRSKKDELRLVRIVSTAIKLFFEGIQKENDYDTTKNFSYSLLSVLLFLWTALFGWLAKLPTRLLWELFQTTRYLWNTNTGKSWPKVGLVCFGGFAEEEKVLLKLILT